MELAIAIKGKIEGSLTSSARQAASSIGELSTRMAQLQRTASRSEAWTRQAQTVRSLSVQLRQAQANVESAARAMRASGSSSGNAARAYETARNEVTRLSGALTHSRDKLQQISAELQKSGFDSSSFAESQRKLRIEIENTAKARANAQKLGGLKAAKENASANLANANANFHYGTDFAMTLAAPLVEATQAAISFESVMADVRKVVDFDTPQQFKEMSDDILKLSQTLPMSAEGIAQIVAAGGQSGIARDELLGFAESAAKMGIAFDITADQAGDMMAKWRTAFHMGQTDVIELADKINYLGNTTAASAPLISDVVTRIGPLGEIGGVASGEIAALGASMVGTGVQSEIAATGIKNLILGMTAGEGATKSQSEAFAALGMNAADMASKMQIDAKGAILEVMEALQALPKEQQATVLSDLFGKESIGAIAPLLSNLDALKDNFNKVADATQYAGSMQAEYDARAATTENSIQLMKNTVSALAVNVGSALLPALNSLLSAVAPIAARFAEWASQNSELVIMLAGIAVGIGAVITGILAFSVAVATFQFAAASIAAFKAAITSATIVTKGMAVAQGALNLVMSLNPIVAVVVAVMALVAAVVYLWNTNEGFRNAIISAYEAVKGAIIGAWESITTAFSSAVDFIGDGINSVIDFILALPGNIIMGFGMVIGYLSVIIPQIPTYIANAITAIGELIATGVTLYIEFLVTFWSTVISGFISMATFVVGIIPQVWQAIADMVTQAIAFLPQLPAACIEAGSQFVSAASTWASEAYTAVMDWISQLPSAISNTISSAWEGIKAKFSAGFSVGVSAATNATGGVYNKPLLTWVAEAGNPEVIVPINNSARSMALWQTAGQMLGALPTTAPDMGATGGTEAMPAAASASPGGDIRIEYSPTVNVTGDAGDGTLARIRALLDEQRAEFERELPRMLAGLSANERRLSYV